MICPRCSIAEIRNGASQCPLCSFTPHGGVLLDEQVVDEVRDAVQRALADYFEIDGVERLGERSFVYRAIDLATQRAVALKVMPVPNLVDHDLARRFERYVSQAAALRHAHIVTVLQFGAKRSFLWYSMELMRGRSLAELMRVTGPMEFETCLRIADQVGSALDFAHRHGVVHGNLKPSNVLLDEVGWVRVSDFAILEAFGQPREARVGAPVVHRPEYLAPERFFQRTSGASADQYALAVIVYECFSGSLPFVGDAFDELARQHAEEPPPRLSAVRRDLPVPTMEAVQRALGKTAVSRFPSVLDFVTALSGVRQPGPRAGVRAPEAAPKEAPVLVVDEPRPWSTRKRVSAVAIALAALLIVSALAFPDWWGGVVRSATGWVSGRASEGARAPRWETLDPVPPSPSSDDSGAGSTVSGGARPDPAADRPQVTAAPGRLMVNSNPWGRLVVDGEILGNTPQLAVDLAPGVHTIRVERDGFEPFEQQIRVQSRDTVRLTNITLRPPPQ
jgi:serine/threonine-protein kinase